MNMKRHIGLVSCGVIMGLAFVSAVQAENSPSPSDNMKSFSVTDETSFKENRVRGEVVRVEDDGYTVKLTDGKEVRLHRDTSTKVVGEIRQGTQVESETDGKGHMLSIKPYSSEKLEKSQKGTRKPNSTK
ncbi:MAG: hypothetical protein JSR29_01415 [Nitrospira sp.]|nr:hypothetical protein [Nitrospira sp.]